MGGWGTLGIGNMSMHPNENLDDIPNSFLSKLQMPFVNVNDNVPTDLRNNPKTQPPMKLSDKDHNKLEKQELEFYRRKWFFFDCVESFIVH